uniref:TSP1_CCN domain-containing protein n=1 Tax=Panagrellus redivivus TaxID=6233 RepID=A0A7E4UU20_PANRE
MDKDKESNRVPDTSKSSVSQPQKSAAPKTEPVPLDVTDGIPDDSALQENTLDADPNPAEVGEFTEQLSDVSDGDDDQMQRTASRNALSTWYRRIQPLIRNKRVRVFAIINTFLTAINLILFIGCIIILGFVIFEVIAVKNRSSVDKPCIYQWSEWSECSATCRGLNDTSPPVKTRTVVKDSIIQARGNKYKACESDLEDKTDTAPCNTHKCPQKLSSFKFIGDFRLDVGNEDNDCYIIRDVPIGDNLIEIDVTDLHIECKCGDPCKEMMKNQ